MYQRFGFEIEESIKAMSALHFRWSFWAPLKIKVLLRHTKLPYRCFPSLLHLSYIYTLYSWQSSFKYSAFIFCVFFLDLPPFFLQLRGPPETCLSIKEKGKEREREIAVIEKQESKWRPDSAAKKKKHMWGCHFLILCSNALWRKFVKLDQGCLKLVYKGVSEGRRRRNVVHLRRLRCLQSARLGGTAFFPLFSSSEL